MQNVSSPVQSLADVDDSYARIVDRLDDIGQRYRLVQLLRGVTLFFCCAITAAITCAMIANYAEHGRIAFLLLVVLIAWTIASASLWIIRPLLLKPTAVQMARLVETRVSGIHNGLTNSLLLAKSPHLSASPFLPQIFDEIITTAEQRPLNDAVAMTSVRPLAIRAGGVAVIAICVACFASSAVARGLHQMFNPTAFIPRSASAKLLDVKPGDLTLVAGQPLEISVLAEDDQSNNANLIFDDATPAVSLVAVATIGSASRDADNNAGVRTQSFSYRQDHVDHSMRYRVEVGGTQSPWYSVTVVKQVKLEQLALTVTPPHYAAARSPGTTITLTADTIDKTPIAVPIGSQIQINLAIDVPATGAMLQLGDETPVAMTGTRAGRTFAGHFEVTHDTPMAVLLTEGTGQVIARLPEQTLVIHGTPDSPPVIEMKWPTQDSTAAPNTPLKVQATIKDDYGLTEAKVFMSTSPDAELQPVDDVHLTGDPASTELSFDLPLQPEQTSHGRSVRVRVDATDNRDLGADAGPQTTTGTVYEIRFRDPALIAQERKDELDQLRAVLNDLLKKQRGLNDQTVAIQLDQAKSIEAMVRPVREGQLALHDTMEKVAATFPFADADRMVQRTLQMLAVNPAKDAVDLASELQTESAVPQRTKFSSELQSRQRRIISTLESLLALLGTASEATTQPTTRGGELLSQSDAFKKLDEEMKQFMKEQQRILDQTAGLAKKPVDRFDDNDKAQLAQLAMAQEKLDAFMQQKLSDFAKLAEQDMSNPALLKDITQAYSEVTMAKDALKQKAVEMAIPAEENSLELAKEISSNLERWLSNVPDRQQWNMEDPLTKNDIPMPELPTQLEDMIGDLLEQQEDLDDQMEDANANWHDSADKGIGWDAADGPIADMSAKGVTGNQLPNNNEMDGRSGEGRSGKSMGEFVGDTAVGKGGRNTPTRLDPTPFQKGQIADSSKDPTGGATGGGKLSGEGGEGLEGPVPPAIKQTMQRLAQKQAEIRNTAERLNLKYQLNRYDNFRLAEAGVMMRQVETDLEAGRYQNAMRRRDLLVDTLDTSRMLMGGEIHVQQDTTPTGNAKIKTDIADAMKGQLPAAWSDALKQYYEKLGQE